MTKIRLHIVAQLASLVLLLHLLSHSVAVNVNNASVKCIEKEKRALLAFKREIADYFNRLSSWGSGEHQKECCQWEGLECSNLTSHVVKLDLKSTNIWQPLEGNISSSLTQLLHLNYLDLSNNGFQWSIPKFIGSLTHLKYLNLSRNSFEGIIPNELGNLTHLQYLDLGNNNLLTGKIPNELWSLSNLVYLDLSHTVLRFMTIPHQLGNLSSLHHLDLSDTVITGIIPHHLGNLSHLKYLDLGLSLYFYPSEQSFLSSDLEWVSHLKYLRTLKLQRVNLSSAKNWQQQVSHLLHLQELDLSLCALESSISPWFLNYSNNFAILRLSGNHLSGPIPKAIENFTFLQELSLGGNLLEGTIPRRLLEICSLRVLDLNNNNLTGLFDDFVPAFHHCPRRHLKVLDLSWNQFTGSIPSLSQFFSLEILHLGGNNLDGTLNESIGQLSNLQELSLRYNAMHGVITEAHFLKLSALYFLDLSFNKLVLNISTNWAPHFQLKYIYLSSCKLGPSFPKWLQTQTSYIELDISSTEIIDIVPNWFWNLSFSSDNIDLSNNQIRGDIVNLSVANNFISYLNLSSNKFEGSIPSFFSHVLTLDLSNNNFSNANFLLSTKQITSLVFLDLSSNELSGELPDCWMNSPELVFLDLSHNNFVGDIPSSMGLLDQIQSLHLSHNSLVGEIPLSFSNCIELRSFDVVGNFLSGSVPSWIGESLQKLILLSLRSNRFSGILPSTICHLVHLQLLDLSQNYISGSIPKCINNLTALSAQGNIKATVTYEFSDPVPQNSFPTASSYNDTASLIWKGKESKYRSTLGLLRSIDLSNNNLTGEIPSEIMNLIGLVSLNISRNMISGKIPQAIGQLNSLDFLDLSWNNLSGEIPSQISQISRLSVLDLSHNNLSGKIPIGPQLQTRDASAFEENPELCGAPLPKVCPDPKNDQQNSGYKDGGDEEENLITKEFIISMSIGFNAGFWAICCSLLLNKHWRYVFFKFSSDVYDKLYVFVAINMNKLKRRVGA